ncbi:DICT sensory domain-containing protein [Natrinema versiforme]|uniref:DICT domain-containing protein n=1 Tax=Natrinema versiforme JCM 10478 TaxID=1227496 RepID=L9XVE1_9EURY|nr:DICT sensory domain-containing protein [Natrinema versiforme]ELY64573.1 hypothetical protein C489_17509 [Natrinema versiforme JCM 10478]
MNVTTESLADRIDRTETDRKTVRVCPPADDVDVAAIESFFDPHEVDLEIVDASGPLTAVVELRADGRHIVSSPFENVRRYAQAWTESMAVGLQADRPAVVTELTDNTFESYDKQRMIMASRIVEFRAWNAGSGELHAGFQQLSKLDYQPEVYRNLASSAVKTHVYGEPDRKPLPDLELTVHDGDSEELRNHWWVAYDGDGDDEQKIVLLAQERGPNQFYGFWTERPAVVDDVIARMEHLA